MRRNRQGFALAATGVAVALMLAGAAFAAVRGHASAQVTTVVKVTEREYHISLSRTVLPAGTVTFTVHNAGKIAHQLNLSGAGLRTVHVKTILPGKTRSVTVKVGGGKLTVWCPLPGHAALGMKTSLKVQGATTSSGGGGTTTNTGSNSAWG